MRIREIISEEIANWGRDWVHYSRHPMLTINPKQSHQDPAGIYFFPASVNPSAEMWHNMPYRYRVNIRPDARILDLSQITEQEIWRIIDAAGIRDEFTDYITRYPPKDIHKMADMAWEYLQRHYFLGNGRQPGAFNVMFRRLGYDAIFDDTSAIHSGEPQQLLVLDPRIITNVRMTQRKGGGFEAVQRVIEELKALGSQYGAVTVSPIRRPNAKSFYSDRDLIMMARVDITNPHNEKNYAAFQVGIRKQFLDRVSVSLQYAQPRLGYGLGAEYSISKAEYTWKGLDESLRSGLDQIFAPQAVAEVRKLPGPQVVGSGDDFRQDAGVNRSPKQPGRLAGSGKPLKVKPGFVG